MVPDNLASQKSVTYFQFTYGYKTESSQVVVDTTISYCEYSNRRNMASLYIWKEIKVRVPTTTVDFAATACPAESHFFSRKFSQKQKNHMLFSVIHSYCWCFYPPFARPEDSSTVKIIQITSFASSRKEARFRAFVWVSMLNLLPVAALRSTAMSP
jgi:hypothetical protein